MGTRVDDLLNERNVALDWIRTVESEKGRVREDDIYPRLRAWVDRAAPVEILEIGSGQGICSDKIGLAGRNYTGIEPSPLLLDRAMQLYPFDNRRFVSGGAYDLPLSDGAFDAAFSVAVWHLLGDLRKAANELSRVLKENGHFLIITANPSAYSAWTGLYTDSKLEGSRFEGTVQLPDQSVLRDILYLHSLDEIRDSLLAAHLKIQEIEDFRMKRFILIRGQKLVTV